MPKSKFSTNYISATFNIQATNDHSQEVILHCEQEKKTAIEEIMTNMHHSISEQDDLKAEMNMLKDELNKKDVIILQMREEQERSEEQIRKELSRQIREDVSASQEKEMKLIFEEKEAQIKNTFADKVRSSFFQFNPLNASVALI